MTRVQFLLKKAALYLRAVLPFYKAVNRDLDLRMSTSTRYETAFLVIYRITLCGPIILSQVSFSNCSGLVLEKFARKLQIPDRTKFFLSYIYLGKSDHTQYLFFRPLVKIMRNACQYIF